MRLIVLLFLTSSLYATQYNPWFSPLWEFYGRFSYLYEHQNTIETPNGNFSAKNDINSAHLSLQLTPWPYWNGEVELLLTDSHEIPFSYEAAIGTVRYQWFDDICGEPFALVTGVTFSFPGNRYLQDFSFTYHGEINGEFHVTLGKEWAYRADWWMRVWILGGYGIANRGNGWFHEIVALEFHPRCFEWGVFTEGLFGLGGNDIIPGEPFDGYATIAHRSVDVGSYFKYQFGYLGSLSLIGWYNAYARNSPEHSWGLGATVLIPFSL